MCYDLRLIESIARSNSRSGACEDSAELCAPYIGILPDESETEEGSPLDFGGGHGEWFHFTPGDGGKAAFWEGWEAQQDVGRKQNRLAKAIWKARQEAGDEAQARAKALFEELWSLRPGNNRPSK
jgi:hypothetical protein